MTAEPGTVPCPAGPWWQSAEVWHSPSDIAITLALVGGAVALAAAFLWGLSFSPRIWRERGAKGGLRPLPYLAMQTGCGLAVLVWSFVTWLVLNLPSCL